MCTLFPETHAKKKSHIFIAKEKYQAIGVRSMHVLSFEKGEELEVADPVPGAEWWEVSFHHFEAYNCVYKNDDIGCLCW